MTLTHYEQETTINFNEAESTASIYTHNKPLRRRLERLAQERPDECRLFKASSDGRSVEYHIPKKWIKVNPGRTLTAEERAEMAEIARKRFFCQNQKEQL